MITSIRCTNPVSTTARSFLQLSRQQWARSHHHSFEFLLPQRSIPARHPGPQTRALSTDSNRSTRAWRQPLIVKSGQCQFRQSRALSTTAPRQATQAIYHPQQDEDGKDLVLEFTSRAAKVRRYI